MREQLSGDQPPLGMALVPLECPHALPAQQLPGSDPALCTANLVASSVQGAGLAVLPSLDLQQMGHRAHTTPNLPFQPDREVEQQLWPSRARPRCPAWEPGLPRAHPTAALRNPASCLAQQQALTPGLLPLEAQSRPCQIPEHILQPCPGRESSQGCGPIMKHSLWPRLSREPAQRPGPMGEHSQPTT